MKLSDFSLFDNSVVNFFYRHPASCVVQEPCPKTFFQWASGGDPGMCDVTKFATDCPKSFNYGKTVTTLVTVAVVGCILAANSKAIAAGPLGQLAGRIANLFTSQKVRTGQADLSNMEVVPHQD